MKVKNTLRIPIGFVAGLIFLLRADPVLWSLCVGTAIMACGEAVRFISAGTLIKYEGVTRNGIYAFSRNPLYMGSFLIGAGACIIGRDILFALFFFVAFPIVYIQVIKREEKFLLERYGADYERYIDEVPRFWSWKIDIGEVVRGSSVFLAVKNRELLTVMGILAILAVMVIKMMY